MKYKLLFAFVLIMLVVSITAQTYKQYEAVDLKFPFEVNGTMPTAAATCNVSVKYPNSTYLVDNQAANNLGSGEFNITIGADNVTETGEHEWVAYCCDGIQCAAGSGSFNVNPTGKVQGSILDNTMFLVLLFMGIILIIFGMVTSFAWMGFIGSIMFLLSGINTMIYGFNDITNFYTQGVGLVIIGLGIIFMIVSAYEFFSWGSGEE